MSGPDRRAVLGTVLATVGASFPAGGIASTDADLVKIATQLLDLQAQTDLVHDELDDLALHPAEYDEAQARLFALVEHTWELRERAMAIPARTRDGIIAKARIVEAHWGEALGEDEGVAWSLVCDLLGRPA